MTKQITAIQEAINQVGEEAVLKSIPHLHLGRCSVHGAYAMTGEDTTCPICPKVPEGDGTTATKVEHYINVSPAHSLGTNPHQKINPMGI